MKPYKKSPKTIVANNIAKLMDEIKIKEAELARQTGLPQTTVNRLLLGETSDPRGSTLKSIAKFFKIPIDYLLNDEPDLSLRLKGTVNVYNKNSWINVPVISWEQALSWSFMHQNFNHLNHKQWIITEKNLGDLAFAIYSKPFMEPRFRKDSILIVDPETKPEDGQFVVLSIQSQPVTVKQILVDGGDIYLKSFDSAVPSSLISSKDCIIGVIVEARSDLP